MMANLVNLGFRCNPRAAHSTIRLNSVQGAMRDLPIKVGMAKLPCKDRFGRPTFGNFLTINGVGDTDPTEEGEAE